MPCRYRAAPAIDDSQAENSGSPASQLASEMDVEASQSSEESQSESESEGTSSSSDDSAPGEQASSSSEASDSAEGSTSSSEGSASETGDSDSDSAGSEPSPEASEQPSPERAVAAEQEPPAQDLPHVGRVPPSGYATGGQLLVALLNRSTHRRLSPSPARTQSFSESASEGREPSQDAASADTDGSSCQQDNSADDSAEPAAASPLAQRNLVAEFETVSGEGEPQVAAAEGGNGVGLSCIALDAPFEEVPHSISGGQAKPPLQLKCPAAPAPDSPGPQTWPCIFGEPHMLMPQHLYLSAHPALWFAVHDEWCRLLTCPGRCKRGR